MVTTWLAARHSETMWTLVQWFGPQHCFTFLSSPVSLIQNLHTDFAVIQHPAETASCSKYYKAHSSTSQTRAQPLLSVPPSGRCGLHAVWYGVVCSTVDVLVRLQGQLLIAGQAEDRQRYPAQTSPRKSTSWKLQTSTAVRQPEFEDTSPSPTPCWERRRRMAHTQVPANTHEDQSRLTAPSGPSDLAAVVHSGNHCWLQSCSYLSCESLHASNVQISNNVKTN